jgi:hypothetical protein
MLNGMTSMKQVGEFVTKVGLPGAIALYLIYAIVTGQGGRIEGIAAATDRNGQLLERHIETTMPLVTLQQQILNVSLAQCVSNARAQRQNPDVCFSALYAQPQPQDAGARR